jgi:hypothetical protein
MNQPFHELDSVVLTRDLPDAGLRVGDLGVIVHVHAPDAFEVEFFAASGETIAVRTVSADDVRIAKDDDVATPPTDDD